MTPNNHHKQLCSQAKVALHERNLKPACSIYIMWQAAQLRSRAFADTGG